MLRIGTKLGIGIGVLLILCMVIGLVSYIQTRVVRHKVEEITQVREPLNSAVYALENNLVETAFATLGYLSTGDSTLLTTLVRTKEQSPLIQQRIADVSSGDTGDGDQEELRRGFARFQAVADEQVHLRDRQAELMQQRFQALDSMDELLTERIQASVSVNDPVAYRRLQAVMEMKINLNAITRGLGNFLLTGDPLFERKVQKAERDFKEYFTVYQFVTLTPQEQHWSEQLRRLAGESLRYARAIIGLDKERREKLAEFLAIERELGLTLYERIHLHTENDLVRAKQDVVEAGERANTGTMLVLLVSMVFGIVAAIVTTRSITGPIRELASVMHAIANGDRVRRVIPRSSDELRSLGEAFNLMTGRLLQANEDLRAEIAGRQRVQEALRSSEERFRTIFEDAPIGIALSDEQGRLIQTNSALRDMLGCNEMELDGKIFADLFHGEQAPVGDDLPVEVHAGRPARYRQEVNFRRKEGSVTWVNLNVSPVHTDPDRPPRNIMMMEDITARRATDTQMRMLAHTITSMNESVVITDAQDIVISVNPAFCTVYGYREDEVLGKNAGILHLRPASNSPGPSVYERMQAGGWTGELIATRKNGEDFPVVLSTSGVRDNNGSPIAMVSISRDITEQKRLQQRLHEAERQRLTALRRFAVSVQRVQEEERARIARELHDDICQRLTGMKFAAEVIADQVRPEKRSATRRLREFAGELDRAISEVRRISSNLRPSVLDDFGLVIALKMLCREFEALHAVRTTFESGKSAPRPLDPDVEIALYRIAQEALTNIAKHAKASAASLRLLQHDRRLQLIVEDDGNGFSEEQVSHSRETGHGLGLINMRERTQLLGGLFEVDSTPGRGTTVSITIPVGEQTDDEKDADSDR